MPSGFVMLFLHQCASPLARLEVGAEDLGARGAQLRADQCLGGLCLVGAALLVVWRIGHYQADTPAPQAKPGAVRAKAIEVRVAAASIVGVRATRTLQSFAVTVSSTAAKRSRAAARRVGTCSVGSSPAGGV